MVCGSNEGRDMRWLICLVVLMWCLLQGLQFFSDNTWEAKDATVFLQDCKLAECEFHGTLTHSSIRHVYTVKQKNGSEIQIPESSIGVMSWSTEQAVNKASKP